LIYKIRPTKGDIFPRYVLADGDGKTVRTLKAEWMTGYDSQLFVGSHGKEWIKSVISFLSFLWIPHPSACDVIG
jgi:hypothetical protein